MSTASRWILTRDKTNPLSSVNDYRPTQSAHLLFPFIHCGLPAAVRIISQQHMLRFTFHPRLLMRSALGQSRPACQHVMADLWAKGTAASSRGFLKNANRSQCEAPPSACSPGVSMRNSAARHGNIARLYAGCSPPHPTLPHPHLPFLDHPNVSFIFVSQNTTNVRESIIFV